MTTKKKDRFANTEVSVKRTGTQIILPTDPKEMTLDEAISALQKKKEDEEAVVNVNEIIRAFPLDGAHAFMKALKQIYGWATPVPTPGFFGDDPPKTISLEIAPNVYTPVIWGRFQIPGIEGNLECGVAGDNGMRVFRIGGPVRKKHLRDVEKLAKLTRELLATESVYRGKAIRMEVDNDGELDLNNPPKFLELSGINPNELTFSEEVMAQISVNLFTPIAHTDVCRRYKIPLKRGVLLEGPYGTGKTLTAFVTAQLCLKNKWTFILLDKVSGLRDALNFARMYGPAVVFAEDIDRALSGDRSVEMDDILNTIDGIQSKNSEIITILTSNHVENINKAMLRPGRLDAIINVQPPDAKAAEKLIRIYARDMLEEDATLLNAGLELAGRIPAVIREAVERAKLYSIGRNPTAEFIKITEDDLVKSARGMKAHLELLADRVAPETLEEKFILGYKHLMAEGIKSNGVYETLNKISERTGQILRKV